MSATQIFFDQRLHVTHGRQQYELLEIQGRRARQDFGDRQVSVAGGQQAFGHAPGHQR